VTVGSGVAGDAREVTHADHVMFAQVCVCERERVCVCLRVCVECMCVYTCMYDSAGCCSKLQQFLIALCCSVLQCVAVCCSVLQCVAVCCSVLRWAHCESVRMVYIYVHISHTLSLPPSLSFSVSLSLIPSDSYTH